MEIHATNINGLGASQVLISFLDSLPEDLNSKNTTIYLPNKGILSDYKPIKGKLIRYKRFLPNSISRLIESLFSYVLFPNIPTIVLGDIPLRGITNQVVLVHQPNLIYPKVNSFSSKSLKFKINRFLFLINHKYAKKIIVQTGAMADEMIQSYPSIKNKIVVIPQPVPNWLSKEFNSLRPKKNKMYLFYPSAFYPHKKHEFLLKVNEFCDKNNIDCNNFEIWFTLKDEEFLPLSSIKFLKNLGRLNTNEMNEYYQKADALLFLSSMESYGLPLIESLTINLPIIVADFSYSRWVCEDTAYYFKPYEVESFLNAINSFKKDHELGKNINYSHVLQKFPDNWEDVVAKFQHLLIN